MQRPTFSVVGLIVLLLASSGCDLETSAATKARPKSVEETLRDLEQREARVREREVELAEQSEVLDSREATLQAREHGVAGTESEIDERARQLTGQVDTLQTQLAALQQREKELARELEEADARARELQTRQARLDEVEQQLRERENQLTEREDKTTQQAKQLNASTAQLRQREQQVQQDEAQQQQRQASLDTQASQLQDGRRQLEHDQAELEAQRQRLARSETLPPYEPRPGEYEEPYEDRNTPTILRRTDDPRRQTPPPISGEARAVDARLPAGAELQVEFLESLSSARQRRGQTFRTRVFEDIYVDNHLAVSAGSEVLGLVHGVTALRERDGRACLELRFTHLIPRGGTSIPIHAEWLETSSDRSGRDAATIGAATLGGAILGRILDRGGDGGTFVGAILGAATGAVVTGNRGEEATIPQGTVVRLRLEEPVRVPVR